MGVSELVVDEDVLVLLLYEVTNVVFEFDAVVVDVCVVVVTGGGGGREVTVV